MRLGIGSYAFAWGIGVPGHPPQRPLTAFDLLEEARRLGVDVVQFCDNLPLDLLTESELERLEQRVRELEVTVELGTRGIEPKTLRHYLELCRRFNCRFLRVVVDQPGDEPTPDETVARLRPLLQEFAAANVRLAIENHDRFTSATLDWVVDQLGRDLVGICLDTVNSFGALEGPEIVVERLAALTLCVHVKDFTIRRAGHNMGFTIDGCAAGQGRLNVPWLLEKVSRSGHPANAILETWVTPGDSLAETIDRERRWTEAGVRYLRCLIPATAK